MFNHQIGLPSTGVDGPIDGDPGDDDPPGDQPPIINGGYKLQGAQVDFSSRLFLVEQGQTLTTGYKGVFSTSFNSETMIDGPAGASGDYVLYSKGFSIDHLYAD